MSRVTGNSADGELGLGTNNVAAKPRLLNAIKKQLRRLGAGNSFGESEPTDED